MKQRARGSYGSSSDSADQREGKRCTSPCSRSEAGCYACPRYSTDDLYDAHNVVIQLFELFGGHRPLGAVRRANLLARKVPAMSPPGSPGNFGVNILVVIAAADAIIRALQPEYRNNAVDV